MHPQNDDCEIEMTIIEENPPLFRTKKFFQMGTARVIGQRHSKLEEVNRKRQD